MDKERRYFVLRRLHSLSGICPVGAFLLEHFYTNSYAVKGPELFNEKVAALNDLPYLYILEIGLIGIPILFHAVLGVVITFEGSANLRAYATARNWFYVLQRVTACPDHGLGEDRSRGRRSVHEMSRFCMRKLATSNMATT